ncbi:alanine--tRNA ligase [Acholeplasma granularum]|uniref:alanine--tRNA ligase n=1 Tax=Acholeplasma granularum TaxID=264635 RepID=UPI000470BA27|nr:alanine--tRNA ligase [Acholeplasma granularum]
MKYMTSQEIRDTWLKFFESKGHSIEPSASLIPVDDPTLLWINAGVAPLKKYFDGTVTPKSKRITNIQKSIRTNDIDNVGKTARHHTFFEMMGNFSIGDYFKTEAIQFGFELLTSPKYFNMPLDKLYMTYYPSDLDAKNEWLKLGVSEDHLIPVEGNFWEIGAGPSGPDTEIFFDRGEKFDKRGIELIKEDIENDRYIEIWNIVFSQYNADPTIPRSEYKELPNKNIDTGAGLERFACILQNTNTNFETDLHYPIIQKIEILSGVKYEGQMAFKVISDHIKTLTFAISDGANLSNEGRGYVLRRILRRAIKYGKNLGFNEPFLHLLVDTVIKMMQSFYPQLISTTSIVKKIILKEEEKFFSTILDGEKHLLNSIKDGNLNGKEAFKLYDTYGFPIELTLEYAQEHNIKVDIEGFNEELEQQKQRSRQSRKVNATMKSQDEAYLQFDEPSTFVGYDELQKESKVIKVFDNGIVLSETPFYANSGGQVSDTGLINGLPVKDVIKLPHGQHLHIIETDSFEIGDEVLAIVDENRRLDTMKHHTAAHLLHQAIKDVIGSHSHQQGSYNGPNKLTFDINHYESLTSNEILKIEKIVKEKIADKLPVVTHVLPIDEAKKLGANMLFGEKYGDIVRVVDIDSWSLEFCGGTHVKNTELINNFMVTSVESIGSGIFRFECIAGDIINQVDNLLINLNEMIDQHINKIKNIDSSIKINNKPEIIGSFQDILNYRQYLEYASNLAKQTEKANEDLIISNILKDADSFIPENLYPETYIYTTNLNPSSLKPLIDVLYDKIKVDTLILINESSDKASYLVKSGKNEARNVISRINEMTQGKGGGRPDFAQGGTSNLNLLKTYLKGKI